MVDAFLEGRGNPWDYDPGPPRNRRWPRLFAETPNYRALGKEVKAVVDEEMAAQLTK